MEMMIATHSHTHTHTHSELDLEDEPPPLPPRIYHWSDMEDNDDELFQSDDDLDDPLTKWSVSDQQKLYASVRFSFEYSLVLHVQAKHYTIIIICLVKLFTVYTNTNDNNNYVLSMAKLNSILMKIEL